MKELHGLDLEIRADGEVRIDDNDARVLLFQVFRELLFNVAKHSGSQSAVADVRQQDGQLTVTITDQGRGFDVGEAERSGNDQPSVGLTSVKERVDLLGGTLRIESQPGQGTRTTIRIPSAPRIGA
jgi:two-component system CheB/CheR fusion protein